MDDLDLDDLDETELNGDGEDGYEVEEDGGSEDEEERLTWVWKISRRLPRARRRRFEAKPNKRETEKENSQSMGRQK